jgi:hypothetical protein
MKSKSGALAREETKMKIRGTDFVMFQVSDLARAAAFYRETLVLPQEIYSEEYRWAEFNCGNVTLALHRRQETPGNGCWRPYRACRGRCPRRLRGIEEQRRAGAR